LVSQHGSRQGARKYGAEIDDANAFKWGSRVCQS